MQVLNNYQIYWFEILVKRERLDLYYLPNFIVLGLELTKFAWTRKFRTKISRKKNYTFWFISILKSIIEQKLHRLFLQIICSFHYFPERTHKGVMRPAPKKHFLSYLESYKEFLNTSKQVWNYQTFLLIPNKMGWPLILGVNMD